MFHCGSQSVKDYIRIRNKPINGSKNETILLMGFNLTLIKKNRKTLPLPLKIHIRRYNSLKCQTSRSPGLKSDALTTPPTRLSCLQVFKASRPGIPLRVYFLIYTGSVEEQVSSRNSVAGQFYPPVERYGVLPQCMLVRSRTFSPQSPHFDRRKKKSSFYPTECKCSTIHCKTKLFAG